MKPVQVTISKTRHPAQQFVVTVKKPGKSEPYKLKQRYATKAVAKRGAVRNLGGYVLRQYNVLTGKYTITGYKMPDDRPIVFK